MKTKISFSAKLLLIILLTFNFQLLTFNSFAQNIGISTTGVTPNDKALLDIDVSPNNNKGLLVPRLTTLERDAIAAPIPESLFIYNTTTQCFEAWNNNSWVAFGCIGCVVPSAVTASASPNLVCEGSDLDLTGNATDATSWSWTGPNSYTSTDQNPTITSITTAGAGVYTLTASNTCGSATSVSTTFVSVSEAPSIANAGSDINPACDATTATLAGNAPTNGIGTWTIVSGTATITTPSSPTSGVTGLSASGTATLRWTISNSPCTDSYDEVTIVTSVCFSCGSSLAINHTIGVVAPETKSVNYGTVSTDLTGSTKCWITQNLGADNQASSATDATDAAAGWYWQFNRKQGYMVGSIPVWSITSIGENASLNESIGWLTENDPCTIELGAGWRIPTKTELYNADANGGWVDYDDDATGAFGSVLKLHAAGYLFYSTGVLDNRGVFGYYWSSTQNTATHAYLLSFYSGSSYVYHYGKAAGLSVRCLRD